MIYFIDEIELKKKTTLHRNVDWADIHPNVKVASDTYVRPILGKAFYDHLLSAYNGQTLTVKEQDLVDIIQLIVAYRSADLTLTWITIKPTNKGLQQGFGENSAQVTLEMLKYARNQATNMAVIHEKELEKTLERDKKEFPIFESDANKEIVEPQDADQNTGFDIF